MPFHCNSRNILKLTKDAKELAVRCPTLECKQTWPLQKIFPTIDLTGSQFSAYEKWLHESRAVKNSLQFWPVLARKRIIKTDYKKVGNGACDNLRNF